MFDASMKQLFLRAVCCFANVLISCIFNLITIIITALYFKHVLMLLASQVIKPFQSILLYGPVNVIRTISSMGVVEDKIRSKLQSAFEAKHVDVINESYMHNVPKGAETHFKVVVVSEKFDGLPLIKRHRLVNDLLKEELLTGVHALSIVAKTPQQWDESDKVVESSPSCRGGFGK